MDTCHVTCLQPFEGEKGGGASDSDTHLKSDHKIFLVVFIIIGAAMLMLKELWKRHVKTVMGSKVFVWEGEAAAAYRNEKNV